MDETAEARRLSEADGGDAPWRRWGPYLSERQWGTVREDYSEDGNAWSYFPHDHARSRAYHWGEDGLAGFSDDHQRLCFALALWNEQDPIIKERLFGLTNSEGNHGEDVKELYFYLDATPTHSYMKWLYKYPQRAYPYNQIVETNRTRTRKDPEYELLDTGVFEGDRYFDVFVEYAKASPEDVLIRVTAVNRGSEPAPLHLLPSLWFRNTWRWWPGAPKPALRTASAAGPGVAIAASHPELGERWLHVEGSASLLFTENETNTARLFGSPNATAFVKDGINDFLVHQRRDAVNPEGVGTKAAVHRPRVLAPGERFVLRLRLDAREPGSKPDPFSHFDDVVRTRAREADEFYASITPRGTSPERAAVMRQALAGMLWSKQYYFFDVEKWLSEHGTDALRGGGYARRNREWAHMVNDDVISMPDKWEYPWYAAWDLAFHAVALSSVDPAFAKQQLDLMLREVYLHPNGQIPAYEWNFSDVNPPVHSWAALFVHRLEQVKGREPDLRFLKIIFSKLDANFTWWVNRKDPEGHNVFEGGFLGLDNIGVFDRSARLPTGGRLEQADGTAWMAFFCQNMLSLAVEIATEDAVYEDMATRFADHFLSIARAINRPGSDGLWDDEDRFYYDVLRLPDGRAQRLKVRSLVGLLPLCATTVIEPRQRERVPKLTRHVRGRLERKPELMEAIHPTGADHLGYGGRGILALVNLERLRSILARMLDEAEFLSPYGIRSLSRYHLEHPYSFTVDQQEYRVQYLPAESDTGMFGGNSNWRGPIWMPMNALIVRALLQFYQYYGDSLRVECPTGSGKLMNLFEVAQEIVARLTRIFTSDEDGRRPMYRGMEAFQRDPSWRDQLLFFEYFHGDDGRGLGANHQTGWTGLVASLIQLFDSVDAPSYLERGVEAWRTGKSSRSAA
ncbi:MAG TPA: glucosidase [Gammaproteobacteria bacterium]|nr:glucosidase [Gammaproteobacteria bacterium]